MKGEMDRPAVTNPSRFPFRRTTYPTLTPMNRNQEGVSSARKSLHKEQEFRGLGTDQGSKCMFPE